MLVDKLNERLMRACLIKEIRGFSFQVCPVCEATYDVAMQQPFEYHVNSHFNEGVSPEPEETRHEASFWFLDP